MRKKIITLFAACLLALCLTIAFVACDDKGGGGEGGSDKGTLYSIQAPAASDVYTVSGLPEGAYWGDIVTFTVTLTDPGNSILASVKVDNDELGTDANGNYHFTMPAKPVTIVIDAYKLSENLSDGGVAFAESNLTTVTVGGSNDGYWTADNKWVDCWAFEITLDWGQTANLAQSSYIISSDQSVIPNDAIGYREGSESGGVISDITLLIDSSMIAPGTTWLEIYLKSNETSASGTISVQLTVTDHLDLDTMTENVQIYFAKYAEEGDDIIIRLFDKDYMANSFVDGEPAPPYIELKSKIGADGTATFTFDYIIGHEYSVNIYKGAEWYDGQVTDEVKENLFVLGDDIVNGGSSETGFNQYVDGRLSFVIADFTLFLPVKGTWASLGM